MAGLTAAGSSTISNGYVVLSEAAALNFYRKIGEGHDFENDAELLTEFREYYGAKEVEKLKFVSSENDDSK